MRDTKEQILLTALELFSRKGFDAVSVSDIAEKLGITKGALYRHYASKQDIFEKILERMYRIDAERAQQFRLPEKLFTESPESYRQVEWDSVASFTIAQYHFWAEDSFATGFRRMLTIEQYSREEMGQLYRSCLSQGPVAYLEDIFREMMKAGTLRQGDPGQLALVYFAPLYLLIQLSDSSQPPKEAERLLTEHMEEFRIRYATEENHESN